MSGSAGDPHVEVFELEEGGLGHPHSVLERAPDSHYRRRGNTCGSSAVGSGGTVAADGSRGDRHAVRGRGVLHVLVAAATSTPGPPKGLFVLDARLLSELTVLVNGERPDPLAAEVLDPHRATFVARRGDALVIERHRQIGDGLHDEIVVRNVGTEAVLRRGGRDRARPTSPRRPRSASSRAAPADVATPGRRRRPSCSASAGVRSASGSRWRPATDRPRRSSAGPGRVRGDRARGAARGG